MTSSYDADCDPFQVVKCEIHTKGNYIHRRITLKWIIIRDLLGCDHMVLRLDTNVSEDLCVSIAGLRARRSGFWGSNPGGSWEFFSSLPRPERLWGPPSLLSNGYHGIFPWGVRRSGRDADHSPPSSAEVKEWVELYLHSPICLHDAMLN
jgi:hypothetical protein